MAVSESLSRIKRESPASFGPRLNRQIPGSSPGAPTKSNQALAMIKHQNGPFSLEIGLIRLNFGEATWFDALCLCPLFSALSRHEIRHAGQFVKVNWMPIVQWDIGAKKSDGPEV